MQRSIQLATIQYLIYLVDTIDRINIRVKKMLIKMENILENKKLIIFTGILND